MGLFGSKTSLEVSAEPARVAPGDEVRARVTVGDPDKKTQGGRVRLVYRNTYREERRDSDGDRDTVTTHDDVVVAEAPLFGVGGAPAAGTYDVALQVPGDAPPTAADAVEYRLEATIDRKAGRDAGEKVALEVASADGAYEDRAARPAEQPNEFWAEFDVGARVLRPGETVSGTVRVTGQAGCEGRALLARVRGVRRDEDGLSTSYEGEPQTLAEPAAVTAGQTQSHPFAVQVPADARPTFQARHNALEWTLDVYVDRRMRSDPTAHLPLVVRRER